MTKVNVVRNVVICAEDTDAAAAACTWAVDEYWRAGDVFHLVYVVKCLAPPLEIFHGPAGTSYGFAQPGPHHEREDIKRAKQALEARYLPILRRKMVSYQLHLFADNVDADAATIGDTIRKTAEQLSANVLIVAAHNKMGTASPDNAFLGSVTEWLMSRAFYPVVSVPPPQSTPPPPPPSAPEPDS